MKVTTKDGVVIAQAETIEDVKTLLAFVKAPKAPKARKRRRKSKPKVPCTLCGKEVKSLKMHMTLSHPIPQLL